MVKQRKVARSGQVVKHNQTKRVLIAIVLATIGLTVYTMAAGYTHTEKQKVKLQETLKQLQLKQTELEKKNQDSLENQKKIDELTKQLQAKREAARALAEASVSRVQARVAVSGTCAEWIAAAGITDVVSAAELIRRESGCNPNAVNRSSGACGVAQELPCGKSGCSLGDGACQVKWMNRYVIGRYGSWAAAVSFHDRNNWY